MIGEYFIDTCLKACCSIDSSFEQQKDMFTNMYIVFKDYKDRIKSSDIPTEFKDKLDLVYYLSQYRAKHRDFDFESLMMKIQGGRWKNYVDTLENRKVQLSNEEKEEIFKTILDKRKLLELTRGRVDLDSILSDMESGNFTDEQELVERWENALDVLNRNILKVKRIENVAKVASLDLMNDEYSSIIDKLINTVNSKDVVPSGYKYLDNNIPSGGFERRRFYLIGGSSGIGKSAFLINLISNAIGYYSKLNEDEKTNKVFLYITAENLLDETWSRFYCCLTRTPYETLLSNVSLLYSKANDILNNGDEAGYNKMIEEFTESLMDECKSILKKAKVNVIFKYVQPRRTTLRDLESIIETVKKEHGDSLEAVYIDYLDLFSTGMNLELRHELGLISQEFKNFAVIYDLSVISVTQLNRGGYEKNGTPDLTQMGEAMKKVDNADLVMFLQRSGENNEEAINTENGKLMIKTIKMTLLKNRNGRIGDIERVGMPIKQGDQNIFNYRIEELPGLSDIESDGEIDSSGFDDVTGF